MIQMTSTRWNMVRCLALLAALSLGTLTAQVTIIDQGPVGFGVQETTPDQTSQTEDSAIATVEYDNNFNFNRLAVQTELYSWNRVRDLLDVVRCGLAGGVGIGAEVALTDYLALGASAISYEEGVDFPHCIPPLWLINYYDKTPVFNFHTTNSYLTAVLGPFRAENYAAVWQSPVKGQNIDIFPRSRWDIRAEAHAGVIGAYVAIRPCEIGDFFAGIIGLDPSKDDTELDPYALRRPADQFGRSISNIVCGALEIPFNILRVTEQEGDLAGLTKGVGLGVWRFLAREVVGVVEFVTFPFGWEPIIVPEYVFQKKRGVNWQVNRPVFNRFYHVK